MTSQYAPIAPHALPYGRPRCHHDSTDGIPYFMRCPQPPPMPATPGGQTYFNPIIGDISPFYLPQPTTSSPYGPSMQFAIGDAYGSQYYSSTAPYERSGVSLKQEAVATLLLSPSAQNFDSNTGTTTTSHRPQPHHISTSPGKQKSEKTPHVLRTVFSDRQLKILNEAYSENPKPNLQKKEQLCKVTGLSLRVLIIWFQNQRSKNKQKATEHAQQMKVH